MGNYENQHISQSITGKSKACPELFGPLSPGPAWQMRSPPTGALSPTIPRLWLQGQALISLVHVILKLRW